jgi:hypothetical protein|nr:MAG TPA: hypothetical protein [Caudoviricetes sp.]
MNTSLFVGLCEDAGFNVKFRGELALVEVAKGVPVATVSETEPASFSIGTYNVRRHASEVLAEVVMAYALTPIKERE